MISSPISAGIMISMKVEQMVSRLAQQMLLL